MSEGSAVLEQVHLKNFLSLRDVQIPLKRLTVLVGPNASGKSNILNALHLLRSMMVHENPPRLEAIRESLWAGGADHITLRLQTRVHETPTEYAVDLTPKADNPFDAETLSVNKEKVISIEHGEGRVLINEDERIETDYKSSKLALQSAGDYGSKPITSALTTFIKSWGFYNFRPEAIRYFLRMSETETTRMSEELQESPRLDNEGSTLSQVLSYWHETAPERFDRVSASLAACTNIGIDQVEINGDNRLCLLEGFKRPIPLKKASDGTLRLVAYYALLNEEDLPPLIAIEEPERNLHPRALAEMSNILEQLAQRTQVIITTHSSQLLDVFDLNNLPDLLGILLLCNTPGHGTRVLNLEDISGDRAALDGWITDFGIGSAIFDSELLQDLMEEST